VGNIFFREKVKDAGAKKKKLGLAKNIRVGISS